MTRERSKTTVSNGLEQSLFEKKKILSRWDDYSNNENKPLTQLSVSQRTYNSSNVSKPSLDSIFVREYLPRTANDPILPILRDLFVHSFDQFYVEIEDQLKLKVHDSVAEWLDATFDETQEHILNRIQRCFLVCLTDEAAKNHEKQGVIGFLTLKEEEKGSVYIAQFAIDPENKRRGYGTRLLQYLRSVYPPGTFYWGLCRRANRPAVNFYLKHGAKCMDDEEVGTKYGYDSKLYTGLQFTDGISIHTESNASDTMAVLSSVSESTLTRRPHVTYQDNSTMTDALPELKKLPFHKRANCCVLS